MDQIEALERLARLRDTGVLSDTEFEDQKQRLLSGAMAPAAVARGGASGGSQAAVSEQPVDEFRGTTIGWMFGTLMGWLTLALCFVLIGFLVLAWKFVENISASYELTTQRLIVRTGIFMKRVDEIELFRVKDVRVDFSLINQLTGIGQITLRSSDPSSQGLEFVLRDVPDARNRRETLRTLVDQARQRRRVREFDVDGTYD